VGGEAGGGSTDPKDFWYQFFPVNCALIKRETSVTAETTIIAAGRFCWIGSANYMLVTNIL